ncbi:MAG: STAS domain-containing protein [Atopobiaceae bacterium]|nr:STAS domain-containing protein [Atopobiaceae bacterium]
MNVTLNRDGNALFVTISGRVNTATAPELEATLVPALDGVVDLTIDMAEVLYISSAGLRVILTAQKIMARQGTLTVRNLRPEVYEVFDMTGFAEFINIE